MEFEFVPECWRCHRTGIMLFSVYAPGTYYECQDCINEEIEERKFKGQASNVIFSFMNGIMFLSDEEYAKVKAIEDAGYHDDDEFDDGDDSDFELDDD